VYVTAEIERNFGYAGTVKQIQTSAGSQACKHSKGRSAG